MALNSGMAGDFGPGGCAAAVDDLADLIRRARTDHPNLPLSIIVGSSDVLITHFGALDPLIDRYRTAGLKPGITLYPDARHEIRNETNRNEVTGDLSVWIDRNIEARPVHA